MKDVMPTKIMYRKDFIDKLSELSLLVCDPEDEADGAKAVKIEFSFLLTPKGRDWWHRNFEDHDIRKAVEIGINELVAKKLADEVLSESQ